MTTGSQNQAGGNSAPLRRSGRAAVTSQVVSSAVSQLAAATKSYRRHADLIGTPRDTPDLRDRIRTKGAQIDQMIKETSYNIERFMEPYHYDGASPARAFGDGELARDFGEIIREFQETKKLLVERISSVAQAGEAGVKQRHGPVGSSIRPQLRAYQPPSLASTSCGVDPPASRSMRSFLATSSSTRHHPGVSKLLSKRADVSITTQDFSALMKQKDKIRNVCMIADLDKGKSKVADLLMADAGVESVHDYGEQEPGITTEWNAISLLCELGSSSALPGVDGRFVINLFESNYHCDSEPVRMSDGAFVVIDSTGKVSLRTENVLRQALYEGLIPVLVLDNFEQYFDVVQNGEIAYDMLSTFISGINNIMGELPGAFCFHPEKGTVAFSASSQRWAFTLANFADQHASEFGVNKERMMELLWGENFYDADTRKWTTEKTGSPTCKRGFVHFCYDPIMETLKHRNARLARSNMQKWLPASPCLMAMMISHLPSPANSQKDRLENLYEGPLDDRYADAVRKCDPTGPVMVYLSKMIRASAKGKSFAFGRIFSGTVRTGMKVRVMGPNYANRKNDVYETEVTEVSVVIGNKILAFEDVSCGNNVAVRFEHAIVSTNATLTDEDASDAWPIGALRDGYYRLMPQGTMNKFYEIPSSVFRELAHHQDGALRWFWNLYCKGEGGILGDDMGMGKTREVCAFLLGLFHGQFVTSVIIIVPLTVLKQWVEELHSIGLANRLKIFSDSTVKSQSKQLQDAVKNGGILLTTYGLFKNHKTRIMGKRDESHWDYIILDEGHKIKNMEAQVSIALNDAKCKNKIVMTGTPYQNNMKEFYALMNFACPGLLGDENYFVQLFDIPIDKGKHKDARSDLIGQAMGAFKKLQERIGPHMLRRTKELLRRQGILKKKQELTVWLKLTPHQGFLYRKLINVPRDTAIGAFPECQVAENICNHPRILKTSRADGPAKKYSQDVLKSDPTDDDLVESSCKVSFTLWLVKRLLKEEHKILIFSQSIPMLRILQEALQSIVDEEQILYMDGQTTKKERDRLVKVFTKKVNKCSGDEKDLKNSDEKEPLIFVMSTEVGGLGLNLISASRVIIVDPSKNPSTDSQTVDRVYRFGQPKVVVVYRLVTCETVEEHIYRRQIVKGETAHSLLTEGKQIRRAIPRRNRRVLSLPESDFSVSDTHTKLDEEYDDNFDDDMIEEVRLLQEHKLVMSVTNHSGLFSLEEECHHLPLDDEDDDDEKLVLQKTSRGPCRTKNVVIGGSKDAVHPSKPESKNDPAYWNRRGNDYYKDVFTK